MTRGLTHARLAKRLGTTEQAIRQLELGTRKLTLDWIERLSSGLECDKSELLRRSQSVPVVGRVDDNGGVTWASQTVSPEVAPAPPGIDPAFGAALEPDQNRPPVYQAGYHYFHRGDDGKFEICLNRLCVVQLTDGAALLRVLTSSGEFGRWNLHGPMSPPINGVEIDWAAPIEWFKPIRIGAGGNG